MSTITDNLTSNQDNEILTGLDFLWLEITPKCNLNCIHCYAESSPYNPLESKMKFQDWVDTLLQAYELGCRQMQLIGGEPTIHPDMIGIIEAAKNMGYEFIEVYTNGISITDRMFDAFVKNEVHLAFSVYSLKDHVHDLITDRKGSLKKTVRSIERALSLQLDVRIGIITMEQNLGDEEETVTFLKSIGVNNIGIDKRRGIGRGAQPAPDYNPMNELCGACWKGRLTVDAEGSVFPCVFSRFHIVGNVTEKLGNVLRKNELTSFRKEVNLMDQQRRQALNVNQNKTTGECNPDYGFCTPDYCNPQTQCMPDCTPECTPTCNPSTPPCSPQCAPYCQPECNPYSGCRPKN